jgi:hypothetical protein
MHIYNLFRSKCQEGLYCAVPEDRAVPPFVNGDLWEFGGKVDQQLSPPLGFNGNAAHTSVRFNGFYLFVGF